MKIKEGTKVIIARNLGPRNSEEPGDKRDYYYSETGDIDDIPLKSKGIVTVIDGDEVSVEIDGEEYWFHKKELETPKNKPNYKPNYFPSYVFNLASQMPVFILNDQLYVLDEAQKNLKENFFQKTKKEKKLSITESASLQSLEKLTENHFSEKFKTFEKKYLQEIIKEIGGEEIKNPNQKRKEYILINFIVNKVFPYLRKGDKESRITELLKVKDSKKEKANVASKNPNYEKNYETLISRLIKRIEKEKFSETKNKRSDASRNYEPTSALGKALEGKNVAIIGDLVYYLVKSKSKQNQELNISGTGYNLVSPIPIKELKERFYFELSKKIKINTIKTKAAKDKKLRKLLEKDSDLTKLIKKEEYWEEDFGFIKKYGHNYEVFLQVPEHFLKAPNNYESILRSEYPHILKNSRSENNGERYFFFDKFRIAVNVYIQYGEICCDLRSYAIDVCPHPFVGGGDICLGNYNYDKLSGLEKGLVIATLLNDTKRTLLSGVTTNTAGYLANFEKQRIPFSEVKKRKIPITNIKIHHGGY